MKKILEIRKSIWGVIALVFLCGLATSCIKEELPNITPQGDGLTLRLDIPISTAIVTRITTEASEAERTIKRGYLVVFNKNGSYTKHETIDPTTMITAGTNGTQNPEISFSIAPSDIPVNAKLVLILNQPSTTPYPRSGDTYATINTKYKLGNTVTGADFETTANGLPMYGEFIGWTTTSGGTFTMPIIRSVAKLQVALSATITGAHGNYFASPTSVKYQIFNYAINGTIKAGANNALTNRNDNRAPRATNRPIQPNEITRDIIVGASTGGTEDNFTGATYLYEFPYSNKTINTSASVNIPLKPGFDANATPTQNRLAIIVKSSYPVRYYRLDVCRGGPEYIDIQRNHHYRITISAVHDEGYATPELAFRAPASNITYEIIDDTGNITIGNGQYAISVGEELLAGKPTLVPNLEAVTLTVATNVRFILPIGIEDLASGIINKIEIVDATYTSTLYNGAVPETTSLSKIVQPLRVIFAASTLNKTYVIRFKITLGNLEYLSDPITVNRIYSR